MTRRLSVLVGVGLAANVWVLLAWTPLPSNTWVSAGSMAAARNGASATLLFDGRVLVAGGQTTPGVTASAERYSPGAEGFLATPSMGTARANHSATLLDDGRVLVTGGIGTDGAALALAEVYDPFTNAWASVSSMHRARTGHTATLLRDGRVLIAGGADSGVPTDSLEIFDPNPGVFTLANVVLSAARTEHAAAMLEDERVLVAGGFDGTAALDSIDIYDPNTDTVMAASSMGVLRAGLSATTLLGGNVLLLGGSNDSGELASAELYDPVSNTIAAAGGLIDSRQGHAAFLLPHNNTVLVVGGMAAATAVESAELYVPWAGEGGTFFQSNAPIVARTGGMGSALSFPADLTIRTGPTDGALLIAGGSAAHAGTPFATAELYGFATVMTDRADYSPGTTVTMTGTGWVPGEEVTLTLAEVDNFDDPHPDRTFTAVADESGNIVNTEFAPEPHHLGVMFWLTAVGSESQARTSFTDGPFSKLQILLPGETAAPGTPSGKTGTPTAQTAGIPFTVRVNAVDATWNVINTITDTVAITSSDANAQLPENAALVAGTQTFTVTLQTVGSHTVTATDVTDGIKTPNTSPTTTVTAGAFTKLQILLPGETAAPGTAAGKTGTPSAQTAGTTYTVTIRSVDAQWNLVSSTHLVGIASSDANATVQPNAALVAGIRTRTVTPRTAGSHTVTATDITDGTKTANTSPATPVNPAAFTKLQILLPGETAAPGTATGKIGTPSARTAGTAFNVTANAVDANWNRVGSVTDTVRITSTDANATLPANAALVAGTQTFTVTLLTAGSRTVTATDVTDGTKTANTSPATTVTAGAFTKLQLLMPGETAAPGTATGKTGTPSARTAGTAFNVIVNAVDAQWNLVNSVTHTVGITSSDANATLPANIALAAGTRTLAITLRTKGTHTATATDITDGTKTANTSPAATVNTGAFTKLQILLPGETAAPGTATGKTGTPTARTSTVSFPVTVNAVDTAWNLVSSVTDTVRITSSDANATLPANAALAGGTQTFTVTLLTAGSRTVTATDVTDGTKTANTSPATTVTAGAFTKLQLLLPGETAAPGTATGKTGTPSARTAGTSFNVIVNAVDAQWNLVNSVTHTVGVTSSDPSATLPANSALAAGTRTLAITMRTAGTRTVTATDITDGTKTANTSPATTVNPGAFTKLQLLLPGETAAPGTATGKTGIPTAPSAGALLAVTVNAVDANWNRISSVVDTVRITSTDANAQLPANAALVAGTQTFTVTLVTAGSRTVTATDVTDGTKTANTSPATTVAVGAFTKLQLLMPGETAAPGTATGKTGTPSARTAGAVYTVTIRSVDAYWNLVSSTHTVGLTSSDANATLQANAALAAGTITRTVTPKTAGSHTVTATDITDGSKTANTSPATTVNPGAFTKLQILLPGETAAPGTATGKTGTPTAPSAGVSFVAAVNAVDANWNRVSSAADTVRITSSDANAQLPANAALVAGTQTFDLTLQTVGSRTVTATDVTDGTKTANTSPATTVTAGAFTQLQLLLPGETAAPGTAMGKTGTPITQSAGTAFNVTVKAVDTHWNLVSSVTDAARITSSDAHAALPSAASLVAGTMTFSVTLKTAGSYTLTASDIDQAVAASTSSATTVNPGAFARLQILLPGETAAPGSTAGKTGAPTARAAGAAFNVVVNAVDANWNVVNSVTHTVGIASSDANATLPANAALAAGTRTFAVMLATAGAHTATVSDITDGTKTPDSSPAVAVDPGAASRLALAAQPTNTSAGAVVNSGTAVTLEIRDAHGNLVPTSTATVTVAIGANPGNGTLAGTATVDAIAGVAAFSTLSINKAGSGYTLTMASSGLTGVTSTSFDIAAGTAAQFAVTGSGNQTAGTSAVLTLTALDAQGNIAPSYTGSRSVTFSGAASSTNPVTIPTVTDASGTPRPFGTPTTIAFTNGIATAVDGKNGLLTLYREEAAVINATDGTISAASTLAVQVNASSAARLAFTSSPDNGVPRKAFSAQPVVAVQDAFGNMVTTAAVPVTLAIGANPGSGNLAGTTTVTSVNGLASYSSLSIDRAGSGYTLSAAGSGLTSGTSSTFNLSPAQATRLFFSTHPGDATAGTPFSIQPVVKVQDEFGNDSALGLGASLPLTLSVSSGTGVLIGTTVLDIGTLDGNGIAAFGGLEIDLPTTYTLQAAVPGDALVRATSNAFIVAPATETSIVSSPDDPVDVPTSPVVDTAASPWGSPGSSSTGPTAEPPSTEPATTPTEPVTISTDPVTTQTSTLGIAETPTSAAKGKPSTTSGTPAASTAPQTARSSQPAASGRALPSIVSMDIAASPFAESPTPSLTEDAVAELPSDEAATVILTEETSTETLESEEAAADAEQAGDEALSATTTSLSSTMTVQGEETVTLRADVSAPAAGLPVNGGVVTFVVQDHAGADIGAPVFGLVSEGSATAEFPARELPVGSYTIRASYDPVGDARFTGSTAAEPGTLVVRESDETGTLASREISEPAAP